MYLATQKVKPSVKEFIDKLKPGQMIQLISEYSFREGESFLSKGIFVEIRSNSRFIFIPAYKEDPYYENFNRTMGIDLKEITEIKKTRLPKEVSDNLRVVHKEYNYYQKLQKQKEEITQQMSLIYQSMELKHSNMNYTRLKSRVSKYSQDLETLFFLTYLSSLSFLLH